MNKIRCAILGCGNVGSALVSQLIVGHDDIVKRTGVDIEIAGIAVRDVAKHRDAKHGYIDGSLFTDDPFALVNDSSVDIVVELIGGTDPASQLIDRAIETGKSVVSANKELLARRGSDLVSAAASAGVELLYEAAVAGAIPVVRLLAESLAAEQLYRVSGIVNGTTNFVLSAMSEEGVDYHEALEEAQRLGLAESNPSADVDGYDAAAKAAILAGIAYRCDVRLDDVAREGITRVRAEDVQYARQLGYIIKLLAVTELNQKSRPNVSENQASQAPTAPQVSQAPTVPQAPAASTVPQVSVRVYPAMVPVSHPLASVRGAHNAVFIEGERCGEIMLYGQGAGGVPTASAVMGDLVDAAAKRLAGHQPYASMVPAREPVPRAYVIPPSELRCAWYINMDVRDQPGVLAAVAHVFGDNGVSIRSMEQVGMGSEARLIFVTHEAREGDIDKTLEELHGLGAVENIGGILRVFGESKTR